MENVEYCVRYAWLRYDVLENQCRFAVQGRSDVPKDNVCKAMCGKQNALFGNMRIGKEFRMTTSILAILFYNTYVTHVGTYTRSTR